MACREHGGGGGAVARLVGGLLGNLLHHLCAHVGEGAGELDFLGHSHAVLGDVRVAVALLNDDVAAGGPEGDCDRSRNGVDALLELDLRAGSELHLLCACHGICLV
jgi:hypothetical protein